MSTELFDGSFIGQFRKDSAVHEGRSKVVGHHLLTGEIGGPLTSNNRGQLFIGESALFGNQHMRIQFIPRTKVRTCDQDRHFTHGRG